MVKVRRKVLRDDRAVQDFQSDPRRLPRRFSFESMKHSYLGTKSFFIISSRKPNSSDMQRVFVICTHLATPTQKLLLSPFELMIIMPEFRRVRKIIIKIFIWSRYYYELRINPVEDIFG